MFFLCIFLFGQTNILICFDNLIKIYASHHYYTTQTIWYQPIYILFMNDIGIYLSIEKKQTETHKTYIFVKLFKQYKTKDCFWIYNNTKEKSDQIMAKEAYLQIILSLKSTFDILLSHKINL